MASINLDLLNKLVKKLNENLDKANATRLVSIPDFIVEISECAGLISGIFVESSALLNDTQVVLREVQGIAESKVSSNINPLVDLLNIKPNSGISGKN